MKNKIESLKKSLKNTDKTIFRSITGKGGEIVDTDIKENTGCTNHNDCTKDTNYSVCANWGKC